MKKLTTYIMAILSWIYVNAQNAFTNTGNFQIHTGSSITGFGNFTNTSAGSMINNGSFYVKGNISNDQSSMTVGTGTLYLNGSSAQTEAGTQKFKTYNLETNNPAGIILNNDLSISGVHTFSAGMITTSSAPNYLIYESGSSYTGDADNKHVYGWVKKIGTSNFIFPVGNGTVERTIALNNLSANSEFNVKYAAPTPNTSQMQLPLLSIDPNEYWIVNEITGGSALVTMNWDNSKVTFPNWLISGISSTGYDGSNWMDAGGTASGNVSTTGTITSGTVSAFNLFSFGSKATPVPLTLISFNAKRISDYTQITWTTVDEHNVDHFKVERSDDNLHFYSIDQLPARNSGNVETYISKDYNPINHIAYYRLRSIDIDNNFRFSKIVSVKDDKNGRLILLTNPVKDKLTLVSGNNLKGEFSYRINSADGQLLQQGSLIVENARQEEIILKKTIQPGAYFLRIANDSQTFSFKFIRE